MDPTSPYVASCPSPEILDMFSTDSLGFSGSLLNHSTKIMMMSGGDVRNVPQVDDYYTTATVPDQTAQAYSPIAESAYEATCRENAASPGSDVSNMTDLAPEDMDMKIVARVIEEELKQSQGQYIKEYPVVIKPEPVDDFEPKVTTTCEEKPKRKGGRPRDPVLYMPGVPRATIIKKEKRKEQNRRAARRCREKKKAQMEHIVVDYDRIQEENVDLKMEITKLRGSLERMKALYCQHARQCDVFHREARRHQTSL